MQEVRFHGRAGQGILTASTLFAQAAIHDGKYAQAFPDFGPERLGSPVQAFVRIDEDPIEIRSQIYTPNHVAVFEDSLIGKVPVTSGLAKGGTLVINSAGGTGLALIRESGAEVYVIDASKIAVELVGNPTVSTIMLGALARTSRLVTEEGLEAAVRQRFPGSTAGVNVKMIKRGIEEVRRE